MIQVRTGSRLHFGMLAPGGIDWPARRFGGVGMMINELGVSLNVQRADQWSAEGPLSERALKFAHRFSQSFEHENRIVPPHRIVVEQCAPEHAGLGTGTQLGLSVAKALALSIDWKYSTIWELAQRVGRGKRSALGIYGFERGGVLVESGQSLKHSTPSSLIASVPFPEDWSVLVCIPQQKQSVHGLKEQTIFDQMSSTLSEKLTDRLCRLALLGILPALWEKDLDTFSQAVYEFNRLSGEFFAANQGGIYASQIGADLIEQFRQLGITGCGQSSWGPTIFAITASEVLSQQRVQHLLERVSPQMKMIRQVQGWNEGDVRK